MYIDKFLRDVNLTVVNNYHCCVIFITIYIYCNPKNIVTPMLMRIKIFFWVEPSWNSNGFYSTPWNFLLISSIKQGGWIFFFFLEKPRCHNGGRYVTFRVISSSVTTVTLLHLQLHWRRDYSKRFLIHYVVIFEEYTFFSHDAPAFEEIYIYIYDLLKIINDLINIFSKLESPSVWIDPKCLNVYNTCLSYKTQIIETQTRNNNAFYLGLWN